MSVRRGITDLGPLPGVFAGLGELDPMMEAHALEWSPFTPKLPPAVGTRHLDLRCW
jgi:hypothetical protein